MSFGLSRGKELDPGPVAVPAGALPPLPDDILANPGAGRVDPRAWFPDAAAPLEIEIGSGKGTFLLTQAAAAPGTSFLGIEYEHEFYLYAADRIRRAGAPNVRMLCLDAGEFLRWRVASACAAAIHLYFPDPWPKAKHHRRRMVQDRFLEDAARILAPGGELRIVTDHAEYWAWMRGFIDRWTGAGQPFAEAPFAAPPTARGGELVGTNFERKYRLNPGSGGGGEAFFATVLRRRG